MGPDAQKRFRSRVLRDVARRPSVETGASGPGYSGGAERLSERLFGMGPDAKKRFQSRVLRDVARRPSVDTGASVPGQREVNFLSGHGIGNVVIDWLRWGRAEPMEREAPVGGTNQE